MAWRCPKCGWADGEHAVDCSVTEDSDLEWVEDEEAPEHGAGQE